MSKYCPINESGARLKKVDSNRTSTVLCMRKKPEIALAPYLVTGKIQQHSFERAELGWAGLRWLWLQLDLWWTHGGCRAHGGGVRGGRGRNSSAVLSRAGCLTGGRELGGHVVRVEVGREAAGGAASQQHGLSSAEGMLLSERLWHVKRAKSERKFSVDAA